MYFEKFDLKGRRAVVTGGAQGIGAACAAALAEAGAHVVIADIDEAGATVRAQSLREDGRSAEGRRLDVTNSAEIEALAESLEADGPIDILVNNAGIVNTNMPAEKCDDDQWRRHMAVNLDGVFYCARSFGQRMLERGSGVIVNMGSMSGIIVNTPQEQCHYNASKAGVHHLTKSLAAEWASRGVRVNAVAPTVIETELVARSLREVPDMKARWLDLTPMGRLGRPDEIASVVHFLACDASSLMTGAIVSADAGYTCW
ncbi:NAD(P)-dependent dehydrogenase (short-subunit alcohol dehydrogenase family) [Palleronia aestuarii]|uniref:NAD(P)-dependent dehydrogenase (Short-subunit alcohol dehydrogenase family) n=1 Tax=Palleronia aestuarii TaxID=568105 RepID=A0A2W7N0T7_9RHOB|nr:glucose 1-dehydrogenase [Palleronia aestuarii]PZX13748.1 NAD(P)-dependent dehydrogenase (short-subunit alcohol dehydrogenase family) [Palleronia aestuarii]